MVTRDVPERAIVYGAPAEIQGYVKQEELHKYVNSMMNWI